jgi:hypothetical protein
VPHVGHYFLVQAPTKVLKEVYTALAHSANYVNSPHVRQFTYPYIPCAFSVWPVLILRMIRDIVVQFQCTGVTKYDGAFYSMTSGKTVTTIHDCLGEGAQRRTCAIKEQQKEKKEEQDKTKHTRTLNESNVQIVEVLNKRTVG